MNHIPTTPTSDFHIHHASGHHNKHASQHANKVALKKSISHKYKFNTRKNRRQSGFDQVVTTDSQKSNQINTLRKDQGSQDNSEHHQSRLEHYYTQLVDLDQDKLNTYISDLIKSKDPDQAISDIAKQYRDVSLQFVALLCYKTNVEEEISSANSEMEAKFFVKCQQHVITAIETLIDKHHKDIRAGINVTKFADKFRQKGLGAVSFLRDLHRKHLIRFKSSEALFNYFDKYASKDIKKFDQFCEYALGALGEELSAQDSATDKAQIHINIESIKNTWLNMLIHRGAKRICLDIDYNYKTNLVDEKRSLQKLPTFIRYQEEKLLPTSKFQSELITEFSAHVKTQRANKPKIRKFCEKFDKVKDENNKPFKDDKLIDIKVLFLILFRDLFKELPASVIPNTNRESSSADFNDLIKRLDNKKNTEEGSTITLEG